ncbi:murein hydrolase activator EnvC family protein [Niallia circulans]|uniref:Peptidoglycan DD-metalloendopeptidase family protein n=1 Tax=Niallia circulans TaxID=1397 RepID=A0A941JSC8_NIACI|nr:M23 family metallopeptidase [Niallia circulans]MCB5239370.1 peptidoglycan DD-metalloendopeptidase family protein [Niallia circulans]
MKNTLMRVSFISILSIGGISGAAVPVQAAEYTQTEMETKIVEKNKKISEAQRELNIAQLQINKINRSIYETQNKIKEKNQQVTDSKAEIENLQNQIEEINKRINARNGLLKDRARSLQESGGNINYLDVLLSATSFSDFLNRTEAVVTFLEADRNILEDHQTDKEKLAKIQSELETKLLSFEAMIMDLQEMEQALALKKTVEDNSLKRLEDEVKKGKIEVSALENKKNVLINNQVSIQMSKEPVKTKVETGQKITQTAENSQFIWPTIGGTITTYQGMRWGKFHKGIDIASSADYAILAANGGTVKYAGWINGYGNTIRVEHSNGYLTQYAHLDSINVKVDQTVTQGSKIGVMGSTGFSTGIHLDFEIYHNGKLLNPMDVLPNR